MVTKPDKRHMAAQSFLSALYALTGDSSDVVVVEPLQRCHTHLTVWLRLSRGQDQPPLTLEVRQDGLWIEGILAASDEGGLSGRLLQSGVMALQLTPRLDWPELLRLLFVLGLRVLSPPNHADSLTARLVRSRLPSVSLEEDPYAGARVGCTPGDISRQANRQLERMLSLAGALDTAVKPDHIRPLIQETWRHLLAHDHTQELEALIQSVRRHLADQPEERDGLLGELSLACAARYSALEFPAPLRLALNLSASVMRDPAPPPPPEAIPRMAVATAPMSGRSVGVQVGVAVVSFALSAAVVLLLALALGVLPPGGGVTVVPQARVDVP